MGDEVQAPARQRRDALGRAPSPAHEGHPIHADWLPDPFGRHALRWWDGYVWTERVADDQKQSTDPPV
jgi:hypothetical protein